MLQTAQNINTHITAESVSDWLDIDAQQEGFKYYSNKTNHLAGADKKLQLLNLRMMKALLHALTVKLLQVFAIEFGDFAIEFVPFAIEFVAVAIEFVPFAIEFVGFAIEFVPFAIEFVAFAIEFVAFAVKFVRNKNGSWSKHENMM